MNAQHLLAFLWLRWRIRINQWKRGGTANAVLWGILAVAALFLAAMLFVTLFLVGLFALPQASPQVLLYVWDGLVAAFLFFWTIGLFADLQRSESLALDKFLHLPVSLTGAFLVNYLSSLLSVSLIVFLPAMVGLSLALVFAKGPAMLLQLPLLAALFLAVTALTSQFQGWLAALMVNPRRRRTVIVAVTAAFILLCQLPNLVNVFQPWTRQQQHEGMRLSQELADLQRSLGSGQITPPQFVQRQEAILRAYQTRTQESNQRALQQADSMARLINLLLPPGWLPLGAMALTEGNILPALLGTVGLTLIGSASLWRSYRTTVRLYTGQFNAGNKRPAADAPLTKASKSAVTLLEYKLPWLSEQTSAIALSGFRALLRAPEVKMMLLTPFLLVVVFGSMMWTRSADMPGSTWEPLRPLLAFGALTMVLFGLGQLVGNQFGFDRGGFRVFILCPAQRRNILLGKNLAFAPLALGTGAVLIVSLQALIPMRFDLFLAILPQAISMYLLYCLLANWLSILAPIPIAAGSLRPANPRVIPVLLHVAFIFLCPLALVPTLLPLAAEIMLTTFERVSGLPVCLVLSLLECVAVVYLYRLVLTWQGELLHAREKKILEIVAIKAE